MTEYERLKTLRKHLGLTQEAFSSKIGIKRNSYSQIETGVNALTPQVCVAICREFHVSEEWLRDGTGEMFVPAGSDEELIEAVRAHYPDMDEKGAEFLRKYLQLNEEDQLAIEKYIDYLLAESRELTIVIPFRVLSYLGKVAAAGTFMESYDIIGTENIEVVRTDLSMRADYCIGVSGDSMEPAFCDGDILLVKKVRELDYGEIGIFHYQNNLYVKKLTREGLVSLNPKYGIIPNNDDIRCFGRVIGKAEVR